MSEHEFETVLGEHCSPALLGIKPANLVSFSKEKAPEFMEHLTKYSELFHDDGIRMQIVCSCKKHYLLLVYRPDLLDTYLMRPEIQIFLEKNGYEKMSSSEEYIKVLTSRYAVNQQCPHEIGIFLGYPLEDVIGFMVNKGNNFKYCGYWKVYGDVPSAIELFARYRQCSRFACEKIKQGFTLPQVINMKKMCA